MADILYLVHRMPYPPNKGDKVRSYHLLKHLCRSHRVHLGTFIDDPEDLAHLPSVQAMCASVHASRLHPRAARLASLRGLLSGEPLTLPYYRDRSLTAWVADTAARQRIDATVVFSSSMAQYAAAVDPRSVLLDFVDVDSAKWSDYASQHRWPLSWLYRREGARLLDYERRCARQARHSFFATEKEAALFLAKAAESTGRVSAMNNGVDAEFFSPSAAHANPYATGELAVVFTGAMDYWPNIDAVCWFAQEALPQLRARWPALRFHIVGRNPAAAVQALRSDAVAVTGTVPDVRPYLQHAAVVVAPLRLARGIQNKVLEAMAMGRPVVAADECVQALSASPGQEIIAARSTADFVAAVSALLEDPGHAQSVGVAGRGRVLASYDWAAHLAVIDVHLAAIAPAGRPAPFPASAQPLELQP